MKLFLNTCNQYVTGVAYRFLIACLLLCAPGYVWSLDLQTIFENTAVAAPARVAFREERHNPMLKEPMVLTGHLEYLQPGHLGKVIETPFEESFLITDEHIEIKRDGKIRKLSLRKAKPLRTMLSGIEAILAGQSAKLDTMFRYELSGTPCSWSLRLEPKSKRIASHLNSMLVKGDDNSMHSIRIDMKKGEWSMMHILNPETEP